MSGYGSFIKGSQIGGGKATGAIAKSAAMFGDHSGDMGDSTSFLLAKIFNNGPTQEGGDTGLAMKALGGNNQLVGAAGPDIDGGEIDPSLAGISVAQPGALTQERQDKMFAMGKAFGGLNDTQKSQMLDKLSNQMQFEALAKQFKY
jgi:hypothetical protein